MRSRDKIKGRRTTSLQSARSNLRNRHAGASLVEYAFILIIFMTVLLGISGFGHMLYVYHYVNHAAKEATRYASVRGSTCAADADGGSCQVSNSASGTAGPTTASDIQTYVSSMVFAGVDSSKLVVPTGSTYFCGVNGSVCNPVIPTAKAECNTAATANKPGCTVKVTVAYAYNFIFPLLPGSTTTTAPCSSAGFCLSSSSQMVIVH
jgi:Flp pilus assembly protein TadG